ncbi:hypothetical protein [Hyphomonas jannaschiana]|jgi:hypothetical protein|uniref:hypothetical protein n=1 Tax=Hyphomonas jannaschiana TaxID=86 RepID=UPI0035C713E5
MRGLRGICIGALVAAGSAEAGPWSQQPGDIYARSNVSFEQLDGEDGWRGDAYGEYGLGRGWMITGKVETVRYDGGTADADSYRISARKQLWSNDKGWSLGVEGAALRGTTLAGVFGCDGYGGEARASVGRSGVYKARNYYFFADAAWIHQEGGCDRQRFEFGYGTDLGGNFFSTEQVWLEYGSQSADSIKTETQLGYHFPLADVSIGYREELGGEFDEQAILLAVTVRR